MGGNFIVKMQSFSEQKAKISLKNSLPLPRNLKNRNHFTQLVHKAYAQSQNPSNFIRI